jgi:hypothetical protein
MKKRLNFREKASFKNRALPDYKLNGVWGVTLPSHSTKGRFLLSKTWLAS